MRYPRLWRSLCLMRWCRTPGELWSSQAFYSHELLVNLRCSDWCPIPLSWLLLDEVMRGICGHILCVGMAKLSWLSIAHVIHYACAAVTCAQHATENLPLLMTSLCRMPPRYPVLNRPYAFMQWVQAANISEQYVLMSEPDHIFLRPLHNFM